MSESMNNCRLFGLDEQMTHKTPTVYPPQPKPQVRPNAEQRRRLALNGAAIHHINGDPRDNSIENLRLVYVEEKMR